MRALVGKIVRVLGIVLAVVVILLAVAVGGFRLLMAQLPDYQYQLQTWVSKELGLGLVFAQVDARWGLAGPELVFREVSLAGSAGEGILTAREAGLSFSALALLERRFAVDRLALQGVELTLVRSSDGQFGVRGVGAAEGARRPALEQLPSVRVAVREAAVHYIDEMSGSFETFDVTQADLQRSGDVLTLEARADFPGGLGTGLELSVQGSGITAADRAQREWRVFAAFNDADLPMLAELFGSGPITVDEGHGDLSIWLDLERGELARATAEIDVAALRLHDPVTAQLADYRRVAGVLEWGRSAAGWQLAVGGLELSQDDIGWPREGRIDVALVQTAASDMSSASVKAEYLRLQDLTPLIALLPKRPWIEEWLRLQPAGDISAVEFDMQRLGSEWEFNIAGRFADLGISAIESWPAIQGLSGELRATRGSGRLTLASRDLEFIWPGVLRQTIPVAELEGTLVWRLGRTGYRLVSDDLVLTTPDASARSSLELMLPEDGSSPRAEIEADLSSFDVPAILRYLPVGKMPGAVVQWLDRALRAGRVEQAHLNLFGPLAAFPFERGEGQFRVDLTLADAVLDYQPGWPAAEDLSAAIQFLNAGFFASGSGRIWDTRSDDLLITIPDLRRATASIHTTTRGPLSDVLDLLKQAPSLSERLGPEFRDVDAPAGRADLDLVVSLPFGRGVPPEVTAALELTDAELALAAMEPHVSELDGRLELVDDVVTGRGLRGILFDGPVSVEVQPSASPDYRSQLNIEGEVDAEALLAAFGLAGDERVAGQTSWQGSISLPARRVPRPPLAITVTSNLSGIALRYPIPLRKAPAEPANLQLDARFEANDELIVEGHLGASRRFALAFATDSDVPRFARGELRFGGELPQMPTEPGLRIEGQVPQLLFEDWFGRDRVAPWGRAVGARLLESHLEVADFSALGQRLGHTDLRIQSEPRTWRVSIDSQAVNGTLDIPREGPARAPIVATMQRLYIASNEDAPAVFTDPRDLPGLRLEAQEFALDNRRFGHFTADVQPDPLGLRLVAFESQSPSFSVQGSGSWFNGAQGPITRLVFNLASSELGATLSELGFDPIVAAERTEISGSVYWPGGPGDDWSQHLSGDLSLRVGTGSLPEVQPGAGRVMGLLSVAALPRRLSLDFRDVFNRGLVFDELAGDFAIIDGSAYTDNFKLSGPAVEIGIVGRTGIRDHDYGQQVVVTAEPGNMLPTAGFLIAGPGVGAALLIFTQIFKEPLKGIGRASYCVAGSWDEPSVERLTQAELAEGRLCADLPPEELSMAQPP